MIKRLPITAWMVALATLISLAIFAPRLISRVMLNYAQLNRLRGMSPIVTLLDALSLAPDDAYIRWRTGEALALSGNANDAADVLLPLVRQPLEFSVGETIVSSLIDSGRKSEAFDLYESLSPPPVLPMHAAAAMILMYLDRPSQQSSSRIARLLAEAFATDAEPTEMRAISDRLYEPGFWSSELGQRVYKTLIWRSKQPSLSCVNEKPHSDADIDITQGVAAALHITATEVRLGDDMAINVKSERVTEPWSRADINYRPSIPPGWTPSFMTIGDLWNHAVFVLGMDANQAYRNNSRGCAIRIDGLLIDRKPERESARAGVWHVPISVTASTPYVISFVYRTEGTGDDAATIWLSYDPNVLFAGDYPLPATQSKWKRVTIISWNRSGKDSVIQPLLRSFSEGSVWFDDFSIRPIILNTPVPVQQTIVRIDDP